ncbi:MAG: hypothetical protein ACPG8W_19715, partial [Candidatus Promineifilaceae bacterium]
MHTPSSYERAVRDFKRARQAAAMSQFLARLSGEPTELLEYDAVRQQLGGVDEPIRHGLREIALSNIVGSVGRYQ